MHYVALATDYDGTIARDGVVDKATIAALERLRAGARRVILVTGRELDDLQRAMPRLDLFDRVVAENGALLYRPGSHEERLLAPPPPPAFITALRGEGVHPLSVGRAIVATWQPNETKVLAAIRTLGLELQITFNKGAVMVLPAGVNKASGLLAALEELGISPLNCVGVGDAENDMAFIDACGIAIAVANALPALQERATMVTRGARGAGVAELIEAILRDDLERAEARAPRQRVALADPVEGGPSFWLAPQRQSVLLAGGSGSGKTHFTAGLVERLIGAGFQVCLLDPEGDYEGAGDVVSLGNASQVPSLDEVVELLRKTLSSVSINLLGIPLEDRPRFFASLLPELIRTRADCGRPHFIVVDEAHHLMPAGWDPGNGALPQVLQGFLFVTVGPGKLARRVLEGIDTIIALGPEAEGALTAFCQMRALEVPALGRVPEREEALIFFTANRSLRRARVIPGRSSHRRHVRKYAEGILGEDKSFYFRGPDSKLNLRAHNLAIFMQMGDGVDEATWEWHRQRGDYGRWIAEAVKDLDLAGEIAAIEQSADEPARARQRVREAIERRYTLPE